LAGRLARRRRRRRGLPGRGLGGGTRLPELLLKPVHAGLLSAEIPVDPPDVAADLLLALGDLFPDELLRGAPRDEQRAAEETSDHDPPHHHCRPPALRSRARTHSPARRRLEAPARTLTALAPAARATE